MAKKKVAGGKPAGAKKKAMPAAAVPYQFKPGQSGNPSGRPKRKPFTEAVLEALADPKVLAQIVTAQIRKAKKGDGRAFKELRDTAQGKPMQEIELSGDLEFKGQLKSVSEVDAAIAELLKRASNRAAPAGGKAGTAGPAGAAGKAD